MIEQVNWPEAIKGVVITLLIVVGIVSLELGRWPWERK